MFDKPGLFQNWSSALIAAVGYVVGWAVVLLLIVWIVATVVGIGG